MSPAKMRKALKIDARKCSIMVNGKKVRSDRRLKHNDEIVFTLTAEVA